MQIDDAKILLALLPQEDYSEDPSTDGPRWQAVIRRVVHYQLLLRQLMSPETCDAMLRLLERYTDSLNPAWRSPLRDRDCVMLSLRRDEVIWRQVLKMEAKIGPAAGSDGVDVIVNHMIDEASVAGAHRHGWRSRNVVDAHRAAKIRLRSQNPSRRRNGIYQERGEPPHVPPALAGVVAYHNRIRLPKRRECFRHVVVPRQAFLVQKGPHQAEASGEDADPATHEAEGAAPRIRRKSVEID